MGTWYYDGEYHNAPPRGLRATELDRLGWTEGSSNEYVARCERDANPPPLTEDK